LKPGSVDEPIFAEQADLQTFLLFGTFIWLLMITKRNAKGFFVFQKDGNEEFRNDRRLME
jgi:hypothetical protein